MEKESHVSGTYAILQSNLARPVCRTYNTQGIEQMLICLTKLVASLRSHIRLLLFGTISELVYCFYLLHEFPLTRYFQGLYDIGSITRYSHAGFLAFILAFSFLFVIFGLAWREVHTFQDRVTLWIILGFGSIFALTTTFVYPVTAVDIFNYIVQSLIMVQYHANPMIVVPSHFAHDPLMKLAINFFSVSSPYGPLELLIQALPIVIVGRNILASLLIIKIMFSAIMIYEAFFIYKILSHTAPKFALAGTLALAWNPFALLEYSANSHNDILMMFFVVLAIFALVKEHHLWALTLITASALIKFASLPLILLFFIYSIVHQPTQRSRLQYTLKALIIFLSLMIDSFAFFWAGPQTLLRLLNVAQGSLYSFSVLLYDFYAGKIPLDHIKLIGWVLCGICFLYAVWLSSKDFSHLLKGCCITMFALLAFGATFVQPWYLIWPFALAILIPQTKVSLSAFLLLYGATLAELIHAYIFPWSGSSYLKIFVITNSITYLVIFLPPMLLFCAAYCREIPRFFRMGALLRSTLAKPVSLAHDMIGRGQVRAYLIKLVAVLRSRRWLLLLGIISELVYSFYILRDFPLMQYFHGLADMGRITGYSHAGFFTFILAFSCLFAIFGLAWWEVHTLQDRATLWIILGFGAIFTCTTIFAYPITSTDLFTYFVRSLVMVQYHANPMIIPPAHFVQDPLMKLAGYWVNLPSPYGPLGILIQALPIVIAGRNILISLLLFKLMFSTMLLVEAYFIYKILTVIAPKFALAGALALAWNPFALLEYSVNSHNDIAMMLFIVLAVFALVKERHVWALTLITASVLIKFASLPLIPLFFIYSMMHQPTKKASMLYTLKALIVFSSLLIDSFAIFWAGPQTLHRFFNEIQGSLYSFSIFVTDFSAGSISFEHAKWIGWALCGVCFLSALWLASRDYWGLLKGCCITLFALLAFGATFIQPWYFIWPFIFVILMPQKQGALVAIFVLYCVTLVELVQAYIFPWAGSQYGNIFVITNSIVYLTLFFPPVLFLLVSCFRRICLQLSFRTQSGILLPM